MGWSGCSIWSAAPWAGDRLSGCGSLGALFGSGGRADLAAETEHATTLLDGPAAAGALARERGRLSRARIAVLSGVGGTTLTAGSSRPGPSDGTAPASEVAIRSPARPGRRTDRPAAGRSARTRSARRSRRRPGDLASSSLPPSRVPSTTYADAESSPILRGSRRLAIGERRTAAITSQPSAVRSPMTFSIMPSASRPRRARRAALQGQDGDRRAACGAGAARATSQAGEQDHPTAAKAAGPRRRTPVAGAPVARPAAPGRRAPAARCS